MAITWGKGGTALALAAVVVASAFAKEYSRARDEADQKQQIKQWFIEGAPSIRSQMVGQQVDEVTTIADFRYDPEGNNVFYVYDLAISEAEFRRSTSFDAKIRENFERTCSQLEPQFAVDAGIVYSYRIEGVTVKELQFSKRDCPFAMAAEHRERTRPGRR